MSKNGKLIFKTFDPVVTSPFGWRKDPINGTKQFHTGVDYGTGGKEKPQYAIEEGVILNCGTDSDGCMFVYVKYDRLGYVGLHLHLSKISVKKGQVVDGNTIIGFTGKTGRATGVHLHHGWFKISEWSKPYSNRVWEDFELYELPIKPVPTPTPEPKPAETVFKKDDIVKIIGTGNGSSDGKSNVAGGIGYERIILNVYHNRPFPYQVGNKYGTIGFYKAEALQAVHTSQTINAGDTVIVNGFGTSAPNGLGNRTKVFNNTKMKVIAILKNSKNPYALNMYNAGTPNNFKDVTAWFSASDVRK